MVDITQILIIAVAIFIIYYFVKFIISPVLKAIAGIIFFLIIIYILQHFFNLDLSKTLGPLATYLDLGEWAGWIGQLFNLANQYIGQAINFFRMLLSNVPKT